MKSGGEPTNRDRARLIYLRSGCKKSLQKISDELDVPLATVKTWKRRDRWDDDERAAIKENADSAICESESQNESGNESENGTPPKRKRGGQPGNRHAVGNRGGAPAGNHNAFKTGEYARLLFSDMTDEERALIASIPDGTVDLMRRDLALLCVREKRMLEIIIRLKAQSQNDMVYSEVTSHHSVHTRSGHQDTTDTTDTTITPAIDRIHDFEESLTRLRREKQRIINSINDYDLNKSRLDINKSLAEINKSRLDMEIARHKREYGDEDEDGGELIINYDYGEEDGAKG